MYKPTHIGALKYKLERKKGSEKAERREKLRLEHAIKIKITIHLSNVSAETMENKQRTKRHS